MAIPNDKAKMIICEDSSCRGIWEIANWNKCRAHVTSCTKCLFMFGSKMWHAMKKPVMETVNFNSFMYPGNLQRQTNDNHSNQPLVKSKRMHTFCLVSVSLTHQSHRNSWKKIIFGCAFHFLQVFCSKTQRVSLKKVETRFLKKVPRKKN